MVVDWSHQHLKITWQAACSPLLQMDKAVSKKSKTKTLMSLGEYNLKNGGRRGKTSNTKVTPHHIPQVCPDTLWAITVTPQFLMRSISNVMLLWISFLISLGLLLRLCHLPTSLASSALQGADWRKKTWTETKQKPPKP